MGALRQHEGRAWAKVALPLLVGLAVGCKSNLEVPEGSVLSCQSNRDCPQAFSCVVEVGRCFASQGSCVERRGDEWVLARDGNHCARVDGTSGVCRRGECVQSVCGDGVVDPSTGEQCDEGETNSDILPDHCRNDCRLPFCGDGVRDAEEECDDANVDDEDGCLTTCVANVCGDGFRWAGVELCDDGNTASEDFCLATCVPNLCGDGIRNPAAEACDDGSANSNTVPNACRTDCSLPRCGDGVQDAGEDCDDGNTSEQDSCLPSCAVNRCGDGALRVGVEACDDGNTDSGDGCRSDCLKKEACGDGEIDANEQCDDANSNPNDGCDNCTSVRWQAHVVVPGSISEAAEVPVNAAGVAADRAGNVYFTDGIENRVYRLDVSSGEVTVLAGSGEAGYSGDGGPATQADLRSPGPVALDGFGNLYFADGGDPLYTAYGRVIRKIDRAGTISTIAGTGESPGAPCNTLAQARDGEGGPALQARLDGVGGLAVDGSGDLFFVSSFCRVARRIDAQTGLITTVMGDGTPGYEEGIAAIDAHFNSPRDIVVAASGDLFIADGPLNRVRRIDAVTKVVTTTAGSSSSTPNDGGPATSAGLPLPSHLALDSMGRLFIGHGDSSSERVRLVDTDGTIQTIVGGDAIGFSGDGGPANLAHLSAVGGLAVDLVGNLFIADTTKYGANPPSLRIRRVAAATGIIQSVAGSGLDRRTAAGRGALGVDLDLVDFVVGPDGAVYGSSRRHQILRLFAGVVEVVAGSGEAGGPADVVDGEPAASAALGSPRGLIFDGQGNLIFTDAAARVVRQLTPTGLLETLAGTGGEGCSGNGGPAIDATLKQPVDVALDSAGRLYILDAGYDVSPASQQCTGIRRVETDGTIVPWVGDGNKACSAVSTAAATETEPAAIFVDANDSLYIADQGCNRVIEVLPDQTLVQRVNRPDSRGVTDVWVDATGTIWLTASLENRVFTCSGTCVTFDTLEVLQPIAGGALTTVRDATSPLATAVDDPVAIGFDTDGHLLWLEQGSGRLRTIDAQDEVRTLAGPIHLGDGPTAKAALADPRALAQAQDGSWLIADGRSGRVRRLDAGEQQTVIGYPEGFAQSEDNTRARFARLLGNASGIATATSGELFIADSSAHVIWKVTTATGMDPENWPWEVFAGALDTPGYASGLRLDALFDAPSGLALSVDETYLYVADTQNHVLRAIDLLGGETKVVAGQAGLRGITLAPLAQATMALFNQPQAVAADIDGSVYLADTGNHMVHRISPDGALEPVIGVGFPGSTGEGTPARAFAVDSPRGLAIDPYGNLLVTSRNAVRLVQSGADGVARGDDEVLTIYGTPPWDTFPDSVTRCLSGVAVQPDGSTFRLLDACLGVVLDLAPSPIP